MKNNYQAFLLIGLLVLANSDTYARPTSGKSFSKRTFVGGVKKSNNSYDNYPLHNRNSEQQSEHSGEIPTIDIANLMQSIKNQNIPKTQDEKAEVARNIENLRKSGSEITDTIKPKKKP